MIRTSGALALRVALVAGVIVTLVVCERMATQAWILGSPAAGWFYRYYQHASLQVLLAFLASSTAAGLLLFFDRSAAPGHERVRLLLWWIVGLGAVWALRSASGHSLESLFASDGANGFYGFSEQHPAATVLRYFNRVRRLGPLHVQANMPGKLMLVYGLELLTRNPKWLAVLVVVLSSAGGFLLYAFVKQLAGDTRVALDAAILYWFYPARLFFLPIMNTVTPVIVLSCACLLMWWLRTGRTLPAVSLGVALYGLVFFEPLPLAIGLLFLALVARSMIRGEIAVDRWILQACLTIAAFIVTSEAVYAATGFELLAGLRQTAAHATAFNAQAGRPYAFWVWGNLLEFTFGIGFCQAALFCVVLVHGLIAGGGLRERLTQPFTALCLGLLATLAALETIGINRGEVIRLWIFLGCFFQVPAAAAAGRQGTRAAMLTILACVLLQAALGLGMIAFVSPQ